MRKKIGKRIGPVPIALVAVLALAAFISAGLLLAVNGQQTAEAQSSADCTIGAADDQNMGIVDDNCSVPGAEANIKLEGNLPGTETVLTYHLYGANVGEGGGSSKVYAPNTRYEGDTTGTASFACGILNAETGTPVDADEDNENDTRMVPNGSYVNRACRVVDSLSVRTVTVAAPGAGASSETLTVEGDELSQTALYVYRVRPVAGTGFEAIAASTEVDDDFVVVTGAGQTLTVNIKFLGPPSTAKECGDPVAACSTLAANSGRPVASGTTTATVVLTVRDENGDMLSGFAQLSLTDAGSVLFTETNRTIQTVRVTDGVTEAIAVKGLPRSGAFKYPVMAAFEASNGTLTVTANITRLGDAEMIEANAYLCTPGGKGDVEEVIAVEADAEARPPITAVDAVAPNECVSELNALKNTVTSDDPDPVTSVAPGSVIVIYGKATDSAGNKVSSLEWSPADDDAEGIFSPTAGAGAETRIAVATGDVAGTYDITVNDVRDDAEITLSIVVADDTSQIVLTGPAMIPADTGLATYTVTATDEAGNVPSNVGDLGGKYIVAVRNKDARVLGTDGDGFVIFNKSGVGTFQVLMPEDADQGISLSITVGYQNITDTLVVMYGEMMVEPPAPPMLGTPSISVTSDAAGMATVMLMPGDNATKHYIWAQPTDLSQGMYSDEAAGDATMVTFSGLTSGMNYWFIAIAGRGTGTDSEWSDWSGWTAETPIQ